MLARLLASSGSHHPSARGVAARGRENPGDASHPRELPERSPPEGGRGPQQCIGCQFLWTGGGRTPSRPPTDPHQLMKLNNIYRDWVLRNEERAGGMSPSHMLQRATAHGRKEWVPPPSPSPLHVVDTRWQDPMAAPLIILRYTIAGGSSRNLLSVLGKSTTQNAQCVLGQGRLIPPKVPICSTTASCSAMRRTILSNHGRICSTSPTGAG